MCDLKKKVFAPDGTCILLTLFKTLFKIKAIERASCIRFEQKQKEANLRSLLLTLLEQESRAPGKWMDDIRNVKQDLELIAEQRYRGALVRARAEDTAAGQAPSKRAIRIEKARAERNHIEAIDWDGTLSSACAHIKAAFNQLYQDLFQIHAADVPAFKDLFLSEFPRLDDETKERLEVKITQSEVEKVIEDLNPGESPGPDGLSPAFYKEFKYEIAPILTVIFNEAYKLKALPPSYGLSHTVLIPKTDDREKLRLATSYRPIALTNFFAKLPLLQNLKIVVMVYSLSQMSNTKYS